MKMRTRLLVLLASACLGSLTHATTIQRLFSFTATTGYKPLAPLLQASDGNFYGTTSLGGDDGLGCAHACNGTVFKLTPAGQLTVLHTFAYGDASAPYTNGETPMGGLVEGPDGWLYGTTYAGGFPNGYGIVYKISKTGQFQKLYGFCTTTPCSDGQNPWGNLVFGRDGNLYGVASDPIINPHIFRISTSGDYTDMLGLYNTGLGTPENGLLSGSDGNLYGVAIGGVFRVTPGGALTILHSFVPADGNSGVGPLIQAADGKLYGVCYQGGTGLAGTIFRMDLDGANFQKIFDLTSAAEGQHPNGLLQTPDQSLWATTINGGAQAGGMYFSINTGGAFQQAGSLTVASGKAPMANLIQASDGKLYGTASTSGPGNSGTVFVTDAGFAPPAPGEAAVVEPMKVTSYDKVTGDIAVSYGAACFATDHHIVYGPLSGVAAYAYAGQACGLGNYGAATFNPGVGDFFFVLVGNTPALEGSYGKASSGAERPEAVGLAGCDYPQNLSGDCP